MLIKQHPLLQIAHFIPVQIAGVKRVFHVELGLVDLLRVDLERLYHEEVEVDHSAGVHVFGVVFLEILQLFLQLHVVFGVELGFFHVEKLPEPREGHVKFGLVDRAHLDGSDVGVLHVIEGFEVLVVLAGGVVVFFLLELAKPGKLVDADFVLVLPDGKN